MIHSSKTSTDGSSIFLITDGEENTAPFIKDVKQDIIAAGIKVHTLAYGNAADPKIERIARATQGRSYFYSGAENSTGLSEAFANLLTTHEPLMQVHYFFY